MNIGIIGGGSIGLLISSYLAKKHTVTLYVNRKEQRQLLEQNKLQLFQMNKDKTSVSVTAKLLTEIKAEDCFIVCVKQTQVTHVIPYLHKAASDIPIVFLQNGMGHIQFIKKLHQPIYVGVVEHGANRINDYTVNHLGNGKIKLASFSGRDNQLTQLVSTLHDCSFPFKQSNDWETLLKDKLIVNAVINPLTALFDVPNGEVVQNEDIQYLAKKICEETALALDLDKELAWRRVKDIALNTKENISSMRSDLQKRQMTEIEAISGFILHENNPEQFPYTTFVYRAILALTIQKGIKDEKPNHT